jgi:hypothetical protein
LPIWLEFMQNALTGMPVENFPNVVPLEKLALTKEVHVDTPDAAPTEEEGGGRNAATPQPTFVPQPTVIPQPQPPAPPPDPPSTGAQAPSDPRGQ